MPIQVFTGTRGFTQMKAAFKKNWKHYLQEALGLGIFMLSACFFSAMIFSEEGSWHHVLSPVMRNVLMGIAMGSTALFIFYSPFTSPSGSQINPAVTLAFLRMGKMCRYDALFFALFQIIGGTVAVFIMQLIMGSILIDPPVNSAVTVPGKFGAAWASITEFIIAFVTMMMVLFTSNNDEMKKFTRIFAGCLVCTWVIVAGPISGFGMNPARSLASAVPANIWTAFWIYLFIPFAGMLLAVEVYLAIQRIKRNNPHSSKVKSGPESYRRSKNDLLEPLEYLL
ncbi:MAG TPA: aquaporin [Chitinophagaceae bacterium]|nr:aquaporin [Chitinophagaceae bacterium]